MTRPSLKSPLARLVLDGGATALLVLALAYWWLGNLTHEIAGTALFVLIGRHLVNNSYWWRNLRKGRYDLRRRVGLVLNLGLAAAMTVSLMTSFAISRDIFGWLPLPDSYTISEIHLFAAYWVMAIVGLHIGLNWNRVSALLRNLGLRAPVWRWIGWGLGIVLAALGLRSAAVMDLWTRLRFDYSLVMWDFNEQATAFFGHWLAIIALFAFAMHLALLALDRLPRFRTARPVEGG
ncbi:DUF4405 domain-containing protein [Paracoccus aurantiacus]|uniref:DUF4405 domain-containing protein n=1 Tax=Paracoccus aurantiacus TaxID=2599412 RepID=A0A5C6RTX2_9RHOB|nr:DUF4405 domain-containing protein [Paracoccus aurantiacus]TXB65663.1 DUF4405 domain-containing protein [Paracoccus aurantiacus]